MTSVLIRREILAETHRKEVFCAMQGKGDHLPGKKRSLLEKKKTANISDFQPSDSSKVYTNGLGCPVSGTLLHWP